MSRHAIPEVQLGFDALMEKADADNVTRRFDRETGHLPSSYDVAIPFYRGLIERHHAAMVAADAEETMRLREEAHRLALRLNGGEPGILANDDSPGHVLARSTSAVPGTFPLWGQEGDFLITMETMRVRIVMNGVFGIASSTCYWPGFGAYAVDQDRPFLSETGYRSFLGIHADPAPGLTTEEFARKVIEIYVAQELKGKLRAIKPQYLKAKEGA
jgi:hypothetical protein